MIDFILKNVTFQQDKNGQIQIDLPKSHIGFQQE